MVTKHKNSVKPIMETKDEPEPRPGDKPVVQTFTDGTMVKIDYEEKEFQVLEVREKGLRMRFTKDYEANVHERCERIRDEEGAIPAKNFQFEVIINRIRASNYKFDEKKHIDYIKDLFTAFWDGDKASTIEERVERVEYAVIKTFKYQIRSRCSIWEKRMAKWSKGIFRTKPKNALKREAKIEEAKGLMRAWLRKKMRILPGEMATPAETDAYFKAIFNWVIGLMEETHSSDKYMGQSTLEI